MPKLLSQVDVCALPSEKRDELLLGVRLRRDIPIVVASVELREADGRPQISGYAAMFNQPTKIASWLTEAIADTAFDDALARGDNVRVLGNHNPDNLLGTTANGTARVRKDEKGLRFEADLPDTQYARDLRTLIKRGDVRGSSFQFVVTGHKIEKHDDGTITRTITSTKLYDVGPVTFPAYEGTSAEARSDRRVNEIFDMLESRVRAIQPAEEPKPVSFNQQYRDEIARLQARLEGR